MWAFADTPGLRGVDSANYAAVFLPLLLTTHGKANLAKFPGISFRVFVTEFDKNGKNQLRFAVIYGRFQKMPNFPAIIFPHTTYYGKKGNFGNVFRKFLN